MNNNREATGLKKQDIIFDKIMKFFIASFRYSQGDEPLQKFFYE